ncbi:hypothetical protein FKM82_023886 [Ascaphus truei]
MILTPWLPAAQRAHAASVSEQQQCLQITRSWKRGLSARTTCARTTYTRPAACNPFPLHLLPSPRNPTAQLMWEPSNIWWFRSVHMEEGDVLSPFVTTIKSVGDTQFIGGVLPLFCKGGESIWDPH